MVEFSLIFGLLLTIALGAFEYGMLFRDWLSVTIAAREGGRVAASAANYGDADCVILEAATGALQSLESGGVLEVHIYRSDETGSYPGTGSSLTRRYSPFQPGDPSLVACLGSEWNAEHLGSNWDPNDRVSAAGIHWIGVRIEFQHEWFTNFLWWSGTVDFSDEAVFRMEPPAPGSSTP
ncbi:MAG TPA: TadE family protein [Acidimicrobiia bacterium]|nr:TadE family protein [Acidimicrobiia bacterium]